MLAAFVLSAFVSACLTFFFLNPSSRLQILDYPNERSLHVRPTPRTGGIAILGGIVVGSILAGWHYPINDYGWLGISLFLIAAISFLDDRRGVRPLDRLVVHVISAGVLASSDISLRAFPVPGVEWILPTSLGFAISVVFVVWMINLYNFMDGMDGFAAGMAVVGFSCLAVLGWLAGNHLFTGISLVVTAATIGFLIFNFPPARIFMGDAGSASLGLLVGGLSLWGARANIFPFWAGILIFSPFIVDATATLVRRSFAGEKVWQAHKTHYYQRVVQVGWGHRKTVLCGYALMLACGASAIWAARASLFVQWVILGSWAVVYALLMITIKRAEGEKNG